MRSSGAAQRIVFSYHKTGTSLFLSVMTRVARAISLTIETRYGYLQAADPGPDVLLLPHSLIGSLPAHPYRAVRLVRDPRDVWVSGYLYHQRTQEGWCVNRDLDPTPPITYPRVDFSFQHLPEAVKRAYLQSLGGMSYQENLLCRGRDAGLAFELAGYTRFTLAAMRAWRFSAPEVLDVQLECLDADYDGTMRAIFRHLGFSALEREIALAEAAAEDVRRMDDAAIAARPQIYSRTLSKWRDFLSPAQVAGFEAEYGDLIVRLGYSVSGVATA